MSILNTRQICLFSASFFQDKSNHFSHSDPSTAPDLDLFAVAEPIPPRAFGVIPTDLRLGNEPFAPRELHCWMPWSLACLPSRVVGGAK